MARKGSKKSTKVESSSSSMNKNTKSYDKNFDIREIRKNDSENQDLPPKSSKKRRLVSNADVEKWLKDVKIDDQESSSGSPSDDLFNDDERNSALENSSSKRSLKSAIKEPDGASNTVKNAATLLPNNSSSNKELLERQSKSSVASSFSSKQLSSNIPSKKNKGGKKKNQNVIKITEDQDATEAFHEDKLPDTTNPDNSEITNTNNAEKDRNEIIDSEEILSIPSKSEGSNVSPRRSLRDKPTITFIQLKSPKTNAQEREKRKKKSSVKATSKKLKTRQIQDNEESDNFSDTTNPDNSEISNTNNAEKDRNDSEEILSSKSEGSNVAPRRSLRDKPQITFIQLKSPKTNAQQKRKRKKESSVKATSKKIKTRQIQDNEESDNFSESSFDPQSDAVKRQSSTKKHRRKNFTPKKSMVEITRTIEPRSSSVSALKRMREVIDNQDNGVEYMGEKQMLRDEIEVIDLSKGEPIYQNRRSRNKKSSLKNDNEDSNRSLRPRDDILFIGNKSGSSNEVVIDHDNPSRKSRSDRRKKEIKKAGICDYNKIYCDIKIADFSGILTISEVFKRYNMNPRVLLKNCLYYCV